MKSFIVIFIFLSVKLFCQAPVDTTKRPLQVKYCKITYVFTNGPQKGSKTIIFDEWGRYERVYAHTESDTAALKESLKGLGSLHALNIPKEQNELAINTPSCIIKVNLDTKKGAKTIKKTNDPQEQLLNKLFYEIVPKKVVGHESYLGKTCSIEQIDTVMKLWYWNGVCLKKEVLGVKDGVIEEQAIEIDETYIPSKTDFEAPKDVEIREY